MSKRMAGVFALACTGLFVVACGSSQQVDGLPVEGDAQGAPVIEVLSNRSDLISGGDALVELRLPDGAAVQDLRVSLNGADISAAFARRANGRVLGRVEGLRVGENMLSARLGGAASSLDLEGPAGRGRPIRRPRGDPGLPGGMPSAVASGAARLW